MRGHDRDGHAEAKVMDELWRANSSGNRLCDRFDPGFNK
jgi:hypothetical protein